MRAIGQNDHEPAIGLFKLDMCTCGATHDLLYTLFGLPCNVIVRVSAWVRV